jgi:hypothetical protein
MDIDTEVWLCSKFKAEWIHDDISNQLTEQHLVSLISSKDEFFNLPLTVKLGILLSALSMRHDHFAKLADKYQELIQIGLQDSDEWIVIMSQILSPYTNYHCLRTDVENNFYSTSMEHMRVQCNFHHIF